MLNRLKTALCWIGASVGLSTATVAHAQLEPETNTGSSNPYQLITHDFSSNGLITKDQMPSRTETPSEKVMSVVATTINAPKPAPQTVITTTQLADFIYTPAVETQSAPDLRNWTSFQDKAFVLTAPKPVIPQFGANNRAGFVNTPMLAAINFALSERDRAFPGNRDYIDFSADFSFSAPRESTGLNVDLGFSPSAAWFEDNDVSVRRFGAEFRVGQNFDQRGKRHETKSWYLFAGAEGEALVWDTGRSGFNPTNLLSFNSVSLRDRVTVGDVQAGISINRFGGQWSLSWVRREIIYGDQVFENRFIENFGGLSFTLSR